MEHYIQSVLQFIVARKLIDSGNRIIFPKAFYSKQLGVASNWLDCTHVSDAIKTTDERMKTKNTTGLCSTFTYSYL